MNYILAFLVNLFALNIWLWLFQSTFHRKKNKRTIVLLILIMWAISTCAMLSYPLIAQKLGVTMLTVRTLSPQSLGFLIGYIGLIWLLFAFFGRKISTLRKVTIWAVSFLALAWGVILGYVTLPVGLVLYFLITAGAEEFLKFTVGQSFFAQFRVSANDLILFAILSALGFALIENIVYLFQNPSIWLAISRNLTTVIMHIIFTGLIAYIITTRGKKNMWRYIIAFLIGIGVHRAYNNLISYQSPLITAAIIIAWYFIFSYFLYKSDRIYLPK